VGFAVPLWLPIARCALAAPFHPCLSVPKDAIGGLFSVALSLTLAETNAAGRYPAPRSVEPGLSSAGLLPTRSPGDVIALCHCHLAAIRATGGGMIEIEGSGQAFTVPADVIAKGLKLAPEQVQPMLAGRLITSWVEAGVDADHGTFRLTFATDKRRLRLIVDALGDVISTSTLDFGGLDIPPGARRPGAV
jgi:Family of unknown function (DUF6522)